MMDKSLYREYLEEVTNRHIIEEFYGFISYEFVNDVCYIADIFVKKEHRGTGFARELGERVLFLAKEKGCKVLMGAVEVSSKTRNDSLFIFLKMGMSISSAKENFIYLSKDI